MENNYYYIVKTILDIAGRHKFINETYYGDIYEFENSGSRKYSNFVLSAQNTTEGADITTYSFNAFVTDRLTDDKSNLIEVQSLSKTILSQILKECFDNIGEISYTFWTEKFNDLCAGCYASFSVSVPNETICSEDGGFSRMQIKSVTYTENGDYFVTPDSGFEGLSKVNVDVNVVPTTETLNVTENGTYTPQSAEYFDKVVVNVSVAFSLQEYIDTGGKFGDSTWKAFPYESSEITLPEDSELMFDHCRSLQTVDLSGWNTSNVTNMSSMFSTCYSLQTINMSGWDTSKVTSLFSTFRDCEKLQTINMSGWNTSNVTSLFYTFLNCKKLQTLNLSGWNTSNVTSMLGTFNGCTSLQTLDLSRWDISEVMSMASTFYNCTSLQTIIGSHTLEEVEAGTVVALKNAGTGTYIDLRNAPALHYSSFLATIKGAYDRKAAGLSNQTFYLSSTAYDACYNDDGTTPDTTVIESRQAEFIALLTAKGYNLAFA